MYKDVPQKRECRQTRRDTGQYALVTAVHNQKRLEQKLRTILKRCVHRLYGIRIADLMSNGLDASAVVMVSALVLFDTPQYAMISIRYAQQENMHAEGSGPYWIVISAQQPKRIHLTQAERHHDQSDRCQSPHRLIAIEVQCGQPCVHKQFGNKDQRTEPNEIGFDDEL